MKKALAVLALLAFVMTGAMAMALDDEATFNVNLPLTVPYVSISVDKAALTLASGGPWPRTTIDGPIRVSVYWNNCEHGIFMCLKADDFVGVNPANTIPCGLCRFWRGDFGGTPVHWNSPYFQLTYPPYEDANLGWLDTTVANGEAWADFNIEMSDPGDPAVDDYSTTVYLKIEQYIP